MDFDKVSTYRYELDPSLIAQAPLPNRSDSKLLILDRSAGSIRHDSFRNVVEHLDPGDELVFNDSRVWKARFYGRRDPEGGEVECLLLKAEGETGECLLKPAKRLHPGDRVALPDSSRLEILSRNEISFNVRRILEHVHAPLGEWHAFLEAHGEIPLPPYIKNKLDDESRYQTVYASAFGSSAAPTAGLHFTPEILQTVEKKGIAVRRLTLHVGLGTFLPFYGDDLRRENLHSESYEIPETTAAALRKARLEKRRVIAVGTTSLRALEDSYRRFGEYRSGWESTRLFIRPPQEVRSADALITNFHLPESSLLMLVAAFAGYERIMSAYREAVQERYRFFSLGDAMFIA